MNTLGLLNPLLQFLSMFGLFFFIQLQYIKTDDKSMISKCVPLLSGEGESEKGVLSRGTQMSPLIAGLSKGLEE